MLLLVENISNNSNKLLRTSETFGKDKIFCSVVFNELIIMI